MPLKHDYGYAFERVWTVYPLHVAKMAAFKAFEKLKLTDAEVQELVLHIEKRKKDDLRWLGDKNGHRFIPHLATFLNQARYEDDYPRARREGGRSAPGVLTVSDEDNKRAWALDQQRKGFAVPASYQHYLNNLH